MAHRRNEGWDGAHKIYEADVTGRMGEQQVVTLLYRLVARHLEPEDVIAASLPARATGYRVLLELHREPQGG